MRDVATEAGVSPMTVSNALTGRRPVSARTRQLVMETVERLGYQVNVAARSLRQGRTGVVGIAVPTLDSHYYSQLSHRLVRAFSQAGLATVVEETHASREGELAAFRDSRLNAYDGLVIAALGLTEREINALSREVPVVVLGEQELHQTVDHVSMPNVEGAEAATRLLVERGCRRLAVVGSPPLDDLEGTTIPEGPAFTLRAHGFRHVVRDSGVEATAVHSGVTQAAGAHCARLLLQQPETPDGIFCVTDTLAFGVVRGLADHGVRVPDDVLVVGFDDVEDARYHIPSLSSIAPDHAQLVDQAVQLLNRRIADPSAEPRDVTVGFQLVERESTTRPAERVHE
ncbi:LacI family transcriptional regulator [Paenibacillus sp. TRM 82003]|uniref:LacI family DNA-binding transcriptional regulator n=1 Tax=Kineococcus sp. TRM81007 TaxID=2925831 RepID=UPI001F5A944B|nr:LacI family DNA-binding transcriptional regulator [Kineococcus sp. TRM81007]MCI2238124.1 LacI family transcriptional regulator [Kineococcus sp. TRM81007]MCI3920508.1 LacI family transcriptional regulator [Paenibacillus sp. TRM 82003]